MIRFACPQCQVKLSAPDERAGATTGCPKCRARVQVPAAAAPAEQPNLPSPANTLEPAAAPVRPKSRAPLIGIVAGLAAFGLLGVGILLWSFSSSPTQLASGPTKAADKAETKAETRPAVEPPPASSRTVKPAATGAKSQPAEPQPAPVPVAPLPPPPNPNDSAAPMLVLDSGGHTANVRRIFFTPDNQRLVSISHDKTLRIWDVASGEVLQVVRLPIGPGTEGQLHSVAISPDGQTVAVSGLPFGMGKFGIPIYLLSLETGQIRQILRGHRQVTSAMAFSPDGKRLLASSSDGTALIFDLATGKVLHTLTGHTAPIFGAVFSPDGNHVATASQDKSGRIYSATTGQLVAELKGHDASYLSVAWSPDGKTVATGHIDAAISLYNPQGQLLKTFTGLKNQMTSVTFTPDSQRLLFTGVGWGAGNEGEFGSALLDLTTGAVARRFPNHNNTVMHGTISSDGQLAASAGGDNQDIYIWRTSDASVVQHLVGKGRTPWGVDFGKDGSIAFGTTNAALPPMPHPIKRTFRLDRLEFGPPPDTSVRRAQMVRGDLELRRGPDFSMVLFKAGQKVHDFPMPGGKRELCYCYTFIDDNRAIVGTALGLHLVDLQTKDILRTYIGHATMVMSVAPSLDNRFFVTGSADQIICVWKVDDELPLVSLFFAGDEWIAWTPQGYYAASALGERLMGWQVNRGVDALASYYPAGQFRKSLYQPEVIKLLMQTGSVSQALAQVAKNKPIQAVTVAQVLPPTVTITSPSGTGSIYTKEQKIEVQALANSVGEHPVTAMRLLLDGRPYNGQAGVRTISPPRLGEVQQSWTVNLTPGKHVIAVQAESKVSKGLSPLIEVNCTAGKPSDLPNLYVLAIGVNEYPGQMKLRYAVPDAKAIVGAFQKSKAFGKVTVNLLTDKQATKAQIMKAVDQLSAAMTPQDVGILYFSGHGDRDDNGQLFLIPVDVNLRDPEGSCVSGDYLKAKMAEMPGRLIAILDACHSGAATDKASRPARPITDDLVRDLVTDDYGVIVMCSSLGREYSLESEEVGHGYFTYALVEGLAGRADLNRDGAVFLNELELYTALRVKQLSRNEQHPASARPPNIRPFVLAKP